MDHSLKVGDKIRLITASDIENGICTITKIRNFKTKGQRVYLTSEWGYGFMMWFSNMNYEMIEN